MKTIDTPLDLFFDQLSDLHSMETQLCESMPHLVRLCTSEPLCDLIVAHAFQNCDQIEEIAAIFARHGKSPGEDKCKVMSGLIEGGSSHLKAVESPHTRDLMMIAHCLRIEYYEIAAYEFTTLLSGRLGLMREPEILSELLADEKDMADALMLLERDLFETANSDSCASIALSLQEGLPRPDRNGGRMSNSGNHRLPSHGFES